MTRGVGGRGGSLPAAVTRVILVVRVRSLAAPGSAWRGAQAFSGPRIRRILIGTCPDLDVTNPDEEFLLRLRAPGKVRPRRSFATRAHDRESSFLVSLSRVFPLTGRRPPWRENRSIRTCEKRVLFFLLSQMSRIFNKLSRDFNWFRFRECVRIVECWRTGVFLGYVEVRPLERQTLPPLSTDWQVWKTVRPKRIFWIKSRYVFEKCAPQSWNLWNWTK